MKFAHKRRPVSNRPMVKNDRETENQIPELAQERDQKEGEKKRPYVRPRMLTESLMAFGAICNGSSSGGRKDTTGAPKFCNSARLLS